MKGNPFIKNDSSIILKKILFSKKIEHLTNISTNKNNTTNLTGLNNSLPNLGRISYDKSYLFSHKKFPKIKKIKEKLIKNTNNSLIQRENNKSSDRIFFYMNKKEIIKQSKEISLNNYLIDLIKKERIDINKKELLIKASLINNSIKLEKNYQYCLNFLDQLKYENKIEEEKRNKIKNMYDNNLNEYFCQLGLNKQLKLNIAKIVKLICINKKYGSFVHKVFELPFLFDDFEDFNISIKDYEEIADKIIKIYEKNENKNKIDKILENEELLLERFHYYEEKLMSILMNKEKIKKENQNILKMEKEELNILNKKLKFFQEDLNQLNENKKKILLLIEKYNFNNENDKSNNNSIKMFNEERIKEYIGYINEIGKCMGIEFKNKSKNNIQLTNDYYIYYKNTIECLKLKEKNVNENIRKIDDILENGENSDKELILKAIENIKRENKYRKIVNIRRQKENSDILSILNTIKKSEKNIIKNKKIFIDFPFNKNKKNIKKNKNIKNNEDYEYLYYSSSEEKY